MAIITSTATGAWDTGATWVGGVKPANGDSVVIATGHIVTFDADLSGDGIDLAGLTITGTLTADTTAGAYTLKCSADITGAGTFNIGSSGADYPITCTFLIDFDTTASSIDGTPGLTCNFYCVNPTNPVIELTALEAIGQTELGVTTDVTGDTWAVGDAVRIDNIDAGVDSEARTIAAGGISSDHIDVTAGLTAEKIAGSKVVLVTRNIKVTGSTGFAFDDVSGSNLGCEISGCTSGYTVSVSNTISGVTSGCSDGINASYSNTISGPFSGCGSGVYRSYSNAISGAISGCTNGLNEAYANIVSGSISGCGSGVLKSYSNAISGLVDGCTNGLNGSFSNFLSAGLNNCANGFVTSPSNTVSGVITGCVNGLNTSYFITLYGVDFSTTTAENASYASTSIPAWAYTNSYDHDATTGKFKSWTKGGITLSEVTTVPTGFTQGYKMTCEDADNAAFHQEEVSLEPGETLEVSGQIKFADSHAAYLPRLELIDPGADPLWGSGEAVLATDSVASGTSTDWQAVSVSYTNSTSLAKPILVRTLAKRASGDVYFGWVEDKDYPAVGDVNYGTSFDHGSTGTLRPGAVDNRYRYNY